MGGLWTCAPSTTACPARARSSKRTEHLKTREDCPTPFPGCWESEVTREERGGLQDDSACGSSSDVVWLLSCGFDGRQVGQAQSRSARPVPGAASVLQHILRRRAGLGVGGPKGKRNLAQRSGTAGSTPQMSSLRHCHGNLRTRASLSASSSPGRTATRQSEAIGQARCPQEPLMPTKRASGEDACQAVKGHGRHEPRAICVSQ